MSEKEQYATQSWVNSIFLNGTSLQMDAFRSEVNQSVSEIKSEVSLIGTRLDGTQEMVKRFDSRLNSTEDRMKDWVSNETEQNYREVIQLTAWVDSVVNGNAKGIILKNDGVTTGMLQDFVDYVDDTYQKIDDCATKDDIDSLREYVDGNFVRNGDESGGTDDGDGDGNHYVTDSELETKLGGYLTKDAESEYAKQEEVNKSIEGLQQSIENCVTQETLDQYVKKDDIQDDSIDHSNFASKDDIPDVSNFVTSEDVENMIPDDYLTEKAADDKYMSKDQNVENVEVIKDIKFEWSNGNLVAKITKSRILCLKGTGIENLLNDQEIDVQIPVGVGHSMADCSLADNSFDVTYTNTLIPNGDGIEDPPEPQTVFKTVLHEHNN